MALTKEERRAYNQAYYAKNRERLIEAEKQRYYANRERISERRKARYKRDKETILAEQKRRYQENPHKTRETARLYEKRFNRFKRHGLTPEQYLEMLAEQDGVCAICHQECQVADSLSIDHDHESGRVRGLLCKRCNSGLGFFRDSLEILACAVNYLKGAK